MVADTTVHPTITDEELAVAYQLAAELREAGRIHDLTALLKLIAQAEALRFDPSWEDALSPEDVESLERGDTDIASGKITPHEVVMRGHGAVEGYIRRRDLGDVDPAVAAAVDDYRRDFKARRRVAAADA
ncbi:MAG: hypothetical protein HY332_20810 [Chloroflexi bacterium]|nr:hypothetical protein [Chloroflexota bacterium]